MSLLQLLPGCRLHGNERREAKAVPSACAASIYHITLHFLELRGILRSNTNVSDVSNGDGMLCIAPLFEGPGQDCFVGWVAS